MSKDAVEDSQDFVPDPTADSQARADGGKDPADNGNIASCSSYREKTYENGGHGSQTTCEDPTGREEVAGCSAIDKRTSGGADEVESSRSETDEVQTRRGNIGEENAEVARSAASTEKVIEGTALEADSHDTKPSDQPASGHADETAGQATALPSASNVCFSAGGNQGEGNMDTDELFRMVCEPDPNAELVKEIHADRQLVSMHRTGLFHLKKNTACFYGEALVDWLIERKGKTREEAIEVCNELFAANYLLPVRGTSLSFETSLGRLWRLIDDFSARALNGQYPCDKLPRPATIVAFRLEKLVSTLFEEFLTQNGRTLDYNGVSESETFKSYLELTGDMKRIDLSDLSEKEYLTFFINLYNMCIIHANITKGEPLSTRQRLKFLNSVRYTVGGHNLCLQDIKNGVLRGNPSGFGPFRRQFQPGDARLSLAIKNFDNRIHFALNCGAASSPCLRAYSASTIGVELEVATREFFDVEGCQVNIDRKKVSLSRIMSWYAGDFGPNKVARLRWVADQLTDGEKKEHLQKLIHDGSVKVSHMLYDWTLNYSNR